MTLGTGRQARHSRPMKTATTARLPRFSAITIFNLFVLVMLAVLISNKVSREHESQLQSAIRSSHRLIKAAAEKRELVKDQRAPAAELSLPTLTRID